MMHLSSLERLPDMFRETYDLVAQVPEGRVTTYGKVAEALGDGVASRFVGLAMSLNDDIVRVPCRRVVQSDGHLGGYTTGGAEKKARLLRKEGVKVGDGRVLDMENILFTDFQGSYPLRTLRGRQTSLSRRVSLKPLRSKVRHVVGVDIAYSGDHCFAAAVVFDYESGAEMDRLIVEGDASFPYIPTYLAFRELPVVSKLIPRLPEDAVMVYDGNGTLHPKRFGVASHAGLAFGMPTIGVAKKLLCGSLGGREGDLVRPVALDGKIVGYSVSSRRTIRGVYVSPGTGLSPAQSLGIVSRFLRHRVPEPTRLAHQAAEEARQGRSQK